MILLFISGDTYPAQQNFWEPGTLQHSWERVPWVYLARAIQKNKSRFQADHFLGPIRRCQTGLRKSLQYCTKSGGFLKWADPQIIHFNRISIMNNPFWGNHLWKPPFRNSKISCQASVATWCTELTGGNSRATCWRRGNGFVQQLSVTPRNGADAQFQATAKQNSGAYLGLSDRVPQDPMVDSLFPFRCVVIKQLFGGKPQFQADPFAFVEACQICTECEPQGKSFPACACP